MAVSAVMAVAVAPAAIADDSSQRGRQSDAVRRPAYILVDPGTFGGPTSSLNWPGIPVTADGALLGMGDTTTPDPDYPEGSSNPFTSHAFAWRHGRLTDLGALPGNNTSAVFQMNAHGVGAGGSETGLADPNTGFTATNAVLFEGGRVLNLGTLPGGFESFATTIDDRGTVAGFSSNGTADEFSMFPWGTQTRTFVWRDGVMRDIGTLGGPDTSLDTPFNARGQFAGQSYTNSTPNPSTGVPTTHPYVWTHGRMRDLGTLGGTYGYPSWINDHGEVAGNSTLAGDRQKHPVLWDRWHGARDLGTLGGDNGYANWVNDEGDVVGAAQLPGSTVSHGFLWSHGAMRDLPPVGEAPCSGANAVNDSGVIVGDAEDCHFNPVTAMMWRHGRAIDLNTLIAPTTTRLTMAFYINDRGWIVGASVSANGDGRMFLLIPRTRRSID